MTHRGDPDSEPIPIGYRPTVIESKAAVRVESYREEEPTFDFFDDWSPCENRDDPSSWDDPEIDTEPYREK